MSSRSPDHLVILSDFAAVRGGASKLAQLQAGLMAQRGIPVTLMTGCAGSPVPEGVELQAAGGKTLLERGALSAAAAGLWNEPARRLLRDWIARHDTPGTVYHLHGYHQTLSPSVLAPLHRVRRRCVMHAHDFFLACPNGAFFDFRSGTACDRRAMSAACLLRNCDKRRYTHKLWRCARQAVQNRLRRRLLPEVSTILIHRGMEKRLFPQGGGGQVSVLPNPAAPLPGGAAGGKNRRRILYCGDIHRYKGVELLARAGRRAGLPVDFAGSGQDADTLAAAFPEHRFHGWQDRAGLARLMAETRFLVAPTLGPEPFGLAPAEALLSGVPVLISGSMALSTDILQMEAGLDFKAGDEEALAAAMTRLAGDQPLTDCLAGKAPAAGRALSCTEKGWRDALLDLYAGLLTGRTQGAAA